MRLALVPLLAAAALGAAACGSSSPLATAKPPSCKAQYLAWKAGPARAAGKQLAAALGSVSAAGNVEDVAALTAGLKRAGAAAQAMEAYPMPSCADPAGYWPQILRHVKAAGDNAGSASGLSSLVLAMAPLKPVTGMEQALKDELKAAGVE